MADLDPITRAENIIAGNDLTPITRLERFLVGDDTLTPITRLECFVKQYAGGGGATSMTDVTFSGTLAQPLAAAKYATLVQQIEANKACAEINFDFQGTPVLAYMQVNAAQSLLYSNGANIGSSLSASMAFMLVWNNTGATSTAKAIMSGGVADLASMLSQITCTVTIHTLDAAAYD